MFLNERYYAALGQAGSPSEVCDILLQRVLTLVRAAAVHVMPFGASGQEAPRSAVYQRGGDLDEVRRRLPEGLQLLLAEPKLPDLFATPQRLLRVEEELGWDDWIKSVVYQDYFRHMASARQLVAGFADQAGVPRGFMAVSRSEQESAFDAQEQALVLACREEAERALAPFAVAPDWDRPVDEILEALTTALPTPALLIGESGRVLWMNREAELRLECVGLRFASQRFYATTGTALAELVALAVSEAARPGALLAAKTRETSPAWLAPGEAILARRLTLRGAAPSVLVCLHAPTGPREVGSATTRRVQALTVREDEVARLAADGYTVVAIAHRLNIAEATVSSHLKRVYKKLHVCSRVELAAWVTRSPDAR